MITNYNTGAFSDEHIPSVLDIFKGEREIKGRQVLIEICDTSGDSEMGEHRKLVYKDGDLFMLCCAINNTDSQEMLNSFDVEIKQCNSDAPILMIGTKSDMRSDDSEQCTPSDQLRQMSQESGFCDYIETSSKNWQDKNVMKAFQKAINIAYRSKYDEDD